MPSLIWVVLIQSAERKNKTKTNHPVSRGGLLSDCFELGLGSFYFFLPLDSHWCISSWILSWWFSDSNLYHRLSWISRCKLQTLVLLSLHIHMSQFIYVFICLNDFVFLETNTFATFINYGCYFFIKRKVKTRLDKSTKIFRMRTDLDIRNIWRNNVKLKRRIQLKE